MDREGFLGTTVITVLLLAALVSISGVESALFGEHFQANWGNVKVLQGAQQVQLILDKRSGGGFQSKNEYVFASANMRMKLVCGNSAGIVTTFYFISKEPAHDEIDFEFLGNVAGKPIDLQTNVFSKGEGKREQRIHLWFDPCKDFHNYTILWNQQQIALFVDSIPIRVFKNNEKIGVAYPKSKPMRLWASLWNGEKWATDGGKTKINWSKAPFVASYELFEIRGCASSPCTNFTSLVNLDADQLNKLKMVKKKHMTYDYCTDKSRFPSPPECAVNP